MNTKTSFKMKVLRHLYKEPTTLGIYPTVEVYKLQALAQEWVEWLDEELLNKELNGLEDYKEKVIGLSATREWVVAFFGLNKSSQKSKGGS